MRRQARLQVPRRKMHLQDALRLQKRRLQMQKACSYHPRQESLLRNVQEIDRTPALSLPKNKREAKAAAIPSSNSVWPSLSLPVSHTRTLACDIRRAVHDVS